MVRRLGSVASKRAPRRRLRAWNLPHSRSRLFSPPLRSTTVDRPNSASTSHILERVPAPGPAALSSLLIALTVSCQGNNTFRIFAPSRAGITKCRYQKKTLQPCLIERRRYRAHFFNPFRSRERSNLSFGTRASDSRSHSNHPLLPSFVSNLQLTARSLLRLPSHPLTLHIPSFPIHFLRYRPVARHRRVGA
jgi:hypothetical protein